MVLSKIWEAERMTQFFRLENLGRWEEFAEMKKPRVPCLGKC